MIVVPDVALMSAQGPKCCKSDKGSQTAPKRSRIRIKVRPPRVGSEHRVYCARVGVKTRLADTGKAGQVLQRSL